MFGWIFSLLLYIVTIIVGLYLDSKEDPRYDRLRKIYVFWLYVFLCFGYMTGSDWRNYETTYETGEGIERFVTEPASWFLLSYMPIVIPDYWIFVGFFKCVYLYSTQKLVSSITDRWLTALALLVPAQLGFMLIQNPLRFMFAAIVLNYVLYYIIKYYMNPQEHNKKDLIIVGFLVISSVLFHNSCIVYIVLIPLLFLSTLSYKVNSIIIFVLYMLVTIITSSLSFVTELKQLSIILLQQYMEISDYANYELEDNSSIFAIGNILRIVFLVFVLVSKKGILSKYEYGHIIFGFTIFYFFLARILILIPTGFRLAVPFIPIYIIYVLYMLETKRIYAQYIMVYMILSFGSQIWSSYDFIPYSNSIPYILTGHKPFTERHMYNLNEYEARTGEAYDMETDLEL